jgi:ABC-2 type transport system ATP-binding protein
MDTVLEVRGLEKRYGDFTLAEVSFSLPRGYVMGLVGPNGAGKTTTLKSILGLIRRDGGEIRVAGFDPQSDGAEARSRIGFVHDEPRMPRHLTLRRIARLISGFYPGWDDVAFRRFADLFELPLGKRFGALSRGTRTKFALALALCHGAELIVMDEPTAGLDPVFRRRLLDILLQALADARVSILFSTHITADLDRIADYVTLLQNGAVVFSSTKDEILDRWALVKGGLDLLDRLPAGMFRGIHRGPYGFEAITDDGACARARIGAAAVVERPRLEDIVLLTTARDADA